jgi:hypothetical protein
LKLRLALTLCALAASAAAATSTAWEIAGFNDFLKGRLTNLSLSSDGVLQPGPAVAWNTAVGEPAIWSLAAAPDGSIYAGTGHQGKLFRYSRDGKTTLVFSGQQSELFALCVDAKGVVYAGTSPNGFVYRIENGQAKQIWQSPAKYVWGLAVAADGSLFVGTGEPGRVYHIGTDGKSKTAAGDALLYDTGQANVTALAVSPQGHVLAGTDPNGILYEITGPSQATILYDSTLPEIRALAIDSAGNIYAAAMGGAVSTRGANATAAQQNPTTAVVATNPTVVTVTEAHGDNTQAGVKVPVDTPKSSGVATATAVAASPVTEVSGAEKSAIYLIKPDHSVQTLRSSKDDNVYDLLTEGDGVIFSTDDHGRIYSLGGSRTTLLAEPGDGETTRLVRANGTFYAALSNPGRLLAFGPAGSAAGTFESPVHDSTSVARWGHLQWHGMGGDVVFRTRTGNSARPDATWSNWSDPIKDSAKASIQSPVARFIQWKADWPVGATASISTVDIPYLPQNGAPAVHSITVTSVVGTNTQKSASAAATATAAYSVTVTDTGEAPAASSATSASQTVSRLQTTQTQISWQADDPDSDKLAYSVYFRAEDEMGWQLIRSRMFENTLLLDADVFADGRYFFKVVASDSPSNPAQYAREADLVSSPVLIDNTPPLVTLSNLKRDGAAVDLDVDAADKTSPLRLCEFSLDAGYWQPVESTDGVTDAPQQRFHVHLDNVKAGEHLLVVRVYDSANNAGLARIIVR